MIDCIRQMANDMMANIHLNTLVNGDMYAVDVNTKVNELLAARNEVIEMMRGLGEDAVASGMVPASPCLPLNVCGTVSNVLCHIFLDTQAFNYRFNFENRRQEKGYFTTLLPLAGALTGRPRDKSHILRVDTDTHSYVLYLPPSQDDAYLLQGNAATCMKTFTLQEWMNTDKSQTVLSVRQHTDLLFSLNGKDQITTNPLKQRLVDFFSIDDQTRPEYTAFRPTNMTVIFRQFDEAAAKGNLRALYRRANIMQIPVCFGQG